MKEIFLQYIWQNQLFDKQNLQTADGQSLQIIRPGYWNHESGPDFLQAQIRLGNLVWFGAIEIHIDARDWKRHRHPQDAAYDNVILHVAWHDQSPQLRPDGSELPLLLMKHRVGQQLINQYTALLGKAKTQKSLACSNSSLSVPDIYKASTLERAATSRLTRKSEEIRKMYINNEQNWQQTALQCISRAYGFKTNAEAFSTLGSKVPYLSLMKESSNYTSVLALLMGVSGLQNEKNFFSEALQKEADHLRNKYHLDARAMQSVEFRRAPVRPANAPHVRLVQLAAFLYALPQFFDFISQHNEPEAYLAVLEKANKLIVKYQRYYGKISKVGKGSMYNIMINGVAPFQFAFAKHKSDDVLEQKAFALWQMIPAEKNRFTRIFESQGFITTSAMESQGMIEHYRYLCSEGRCLQCPVGNYIMKNHHLVVI